MSDRTFRNIIFSAIILVGFLLYANTLSYKEFNYDGTIYLLNNPLLKDLDYYAKLYDVYDFSTLDEQLGLHSDVITNFMLRPVAYLTFSLNYLMSGFDPLGFRIINLTIHICNSLLVFACIRLLLSLGSSCKKLSQYSIRLIPTTSAFIFLLHPMQTESVTYIMQRFSSLAALFYLATIWLYLVWVQRKQNGIMPGYIRWGSLVVLFFGMFVRESLFTAPILILLFELTVLGSGLKAGLKRAAPHLMLLPVIPLLVILVSAVQNYSSPSISKAINIVNYEGVSAIQYALMQMVVVLKYLRLYILPYGQNIDHDQPFNTLNQLPLIAAAAIIILMVGGAYLLYHRNRDDVRCNLVFVGVCWYFLALSVSSSFIPQTDLMAEHRAYFASVGFIVALICLADLLRTALGNSRINGLFVVAIVACCAILVVLTYNRNSVWQSAISLWGDSVKKSPAKDRPWFNLGMAYDASGAYGEALSCFQKAAEINPGWGKVYEGLGMAYLHLNDYKGTIEVSLRGIDIDPSNPIIYNNLGVAYAETGRAEDAKQAFSTAIALRPGYVNAMLNKEMVESFMESAAFSQRQQGR